MTKMPDHSHKPAYQINSVYLVSLWVILHGASPLWRYWLIGTSPAALSLFQDMPFVQAWLNSFPTMMSLWLIFVLVMIVVSIALAIGILKGKVWSRTGTGVALGIMLTGNLGWVLAPILEIPGREFCWTLPAYDLAALVFGCWYFQLPEIKRYFHPPTDADSPAENKIYLNNFRVVLLGSYLVILEGIGFAAQILSIFHPL